MAMVLRGTPNGPREWRLLRSYGDSIRHEIRNQVMATALDAKCGCTTTDLAGYRPSRDGPPFFARAVASPHRRASAGLV